MFGWIEVTTMISEVYDALVEAGASEEKARRAAEAVATYENRLATIDGRMERLEGRMTLLQWMMATNIVITLGVLGKLLHG